MPALRHGLFVFLEKLLRWCISPHARARALAIFGAEIGRNVRIYEAQFFNLSQGFKNLQIADDVHIGPGCRLDLKGKLVIGQGSTLSPGVTVLTHEDPGSAHGSQLLPLYPPRAETTRIGSNCWIGVNAIVLAGVTIHNLAVVAAGSVVIADVPPGVLSAGNPARTKKVLPLLDR